MAYDKGTATTPVKIAAGRYSVDSFRGEGSYEVNVKTGTCGCPHWQGRLKGTGKDCKHLTAVREHHARELALKAGTLTDAELTALLPKYEARLDIATALQAELAERAKLTARPAWRSVKLWGPTSDSEAAAAFI
jgi:hypothetical protein